MRIIRCCRIGQAFHRKPTGRVHRLDDGYRPVHITDGHRCDHVSGLAMSRQHHSIGVESPLGQQTLTQSLQSKCNRRNVFIAVILCEPATP